MTDSEKADRIQELLEEAHAIIAQFDDEIDPTCLDIRETLESVRADVELLEFDDEGALSEPDTDYDEFEDEEEDEDDEDEDDDEDEEW